MASFLKPCALITGASRGIGKATALALAERGFDLILISRSQAQLETVATAVRTLGRSAKPYILDLASVSHLRDEIARIDQEAGPVTVLVNNAGMGYTGTVLETPLADWEQVLQLNLTSAFQCIQGLLPAMRQRQQGLIVNVASIAGFRNFPGWAAYNVSKAGLISLSKTLAAEEVGNGIRVTTLCPGAVNTPIWDTPMVQADFDRSAMLTPETVAQTIAHIACLPETAVIEDLTLMPSGGAL